VGKVIGMGGFSSVSVITSIELDEVYDVSDDDTAHRKEFAATANKEDGSGSGSAGSYYVLKTLRDDLAEDEHIKGVVDLAIEADFLSVLSHPNIISMRALANSDPHESRFFVILDRLSVTLERKFNYWRKVVGENAGYWLPCCGYCCANSLALHAVWKERMTVALDMAKAIKYLHDSGIIYRDLKPDNIGFSQDGQLKLFDFGLAKRLEGVEKTRGGFYNLTGNTGSLRYMAPEVANDEPYDLTAGKQNSSLDFDLLRLKHIHTLYLAFTSDRVVRLFFFKCCRYLFVWYHFLANLLPTDSIFGNEPEAAR
jgi:serine/threonine protein kinase